MILFKYTLLNSIFAILLFADSKAVELSDESGDGWVRMNAPKDKRTLFIALEEAEPFRDDYGHWLPITLLKLKSEWIEMKINRVNREGNKIDYILSIRDSKKNISTQSHGAFTDDSSELTPKETLSFSYIFDESSYFAEIPCLAIMGYGKNDKPKASSRKIIFRFVDNLEQLKATTKVSRAMAGFDWDDFAKSAKSVE